jgi:hypothetical protein
VLVPAQAMEGVHGGFVAAIECLIEAVIVGCVQSKLSRKSHKTAEERNMARLELIHFDLCEINGVLIKYEN